MYKKNNFMKTTMITLCLAMVSLLTTAQKPFEGIITYGISSTKTNTEAQNELPSEIITTYKGGKMNLNVNANKFGFTVITNKDRQESTFIIEIKEGIIMKMALKTTKDDLKAEFDVDNTPDIRYTNQRKRIAGYACRKVILDTDDGSAYAYVTEDINANGINWLFDNKLHGTIMELHLDEDEGSTTIYAKAVRKMTISDSEFEIPADCMMISSEDAKNMIGGSITF